jgi:hypothetical protein
MRRIFGGSKGTPAKQAAPTGFVHADEKRIVDGKGHPLLLRGVNIGGWMLQEPYLMLINKTICPAQYAIFERVKATLGSEALFEKYRQAWLKNFCTERDIELIAQGGFNSIRVPLHYNLFTLSIQEETTKGKDTWKPEGFRILDAVLGWCEKHNLYAIIDLHAAPGGQGYDSKINDYNKTNPSLWESDENIRKTIALWTEIANRYKDRKIIAAYDLLNEPNWMFEQTGNKNGRNDRYNKPLQKFYADCIKAIRRVDSNHMIVIEGNGWSNNHRGLWPFADQNLVLSFHYYWVEPTAESIKLYLSLRTKYNVPLWVGESGENHNQWYSQAVQLLESHDIGWCWWTYKKLESTSGCYTIVKPEGYQELIDHWTHGKTLPPAPEKIMVQLAENALVENCTRNEGVVQALLQITKLQRVLIGGEGAPVRITAVDYCRFKGIGTEQTKDEGGGYNVAWLETGHWVAYDVQVKKSGNYKISYRIASITGDGGLQLNSDKDTKRIDRSIKSFPNTGAWQTWQTISHVVELQEGCQRLTVESTQHGWNLNWIEFESA